MGRGRGFGWAAIARTLLGGLLALGGAPWAFADNAELPHDWQFGMLPAASPTRHHIDALNDELLIIITLITLFVMGLLGYAMWRFNAKRHPVPTKTTHNTLIEITWTVVPVLILVTIAVPSFKLMYYMDHAQKADMTLKVTGHQWYWSYEYPDQGDISFDSNMMDQAEAAKEGKPRLLEVDKPVMLPVNTVVRILVTSTDVMHSWFMPSMGVQEYAIIGRLNESWLSVDHEGTYYGQCNQICGLNHPFMPIEIKAVSKEDFAKWVAQNKPADDKKTSENIQSPPRLVAAAAQ